MTGEAEMQVLDVSGRWTHRDRQRHHEFPFQVPVGAQELWLRFRWGPVEVGPPEQRNGISLSLFGPRGFQGAAVRGVTDQEVVVNERLATPGFLAGPIMPGEWTIVVDTHEILNDGAEAGWFDFHLEAAARTRPPETRGAHPADTPHSGAPAPAGAPRAAGPRWYRGDLHSHTVHSDGSSTVADRASAAARRGLDFLAITDHNTISQSHGGDPWPAALSRIRGSEITTFHGHLNCFGLSEPIDWRQDRQGEGAAGILEQVARQNAIVSINHPCAFGNPWCAGCNWNFARVDFARVHAIEVWNGRWAIPETDNAGALALWSDLLSAGLRPTAVSGTDSHSDEEDEYLGLAFNYVYAADPREESILGAIRKGHVYLSSGPSLTFRARGSDGTEVSLPGESLPSGGPFDLSVTIQDLPEPATLWYVADGTMHALDHLEPPGRPPSHTALIAERWWRLEIRRGEQPVGDLLAITNPVYIGHPDEPSDGVRDQA